MKKRVALLCLVIPLFAQNYTQILKKVDNSLILQRAQKLTQAAKKMAEATQGKNFPTLDASLEAIHLHETPTMYLHMPQTPIMALPMGKKERWQGELRMSYPLFSGFAITAAIDRAKLRYEKAKLQKDNLKRALFMKVTALYSTIFSLKQRLIAQKKAKDAITLAYKKAKELYDKGLLAPSALYNLEAKKYEIKADITQTQSLITSSLNQISYIVDSKIDSIDALAPLPSPRKDLVLHNALHQREDLLALKKALGMDEENIVLAKSDYFPKIAVVAAIKKQGDSLALHGDGFTNADQSYVGAVIKWNIFNGLSDKKAIEAAKIQKMATAVQIAEYKKRIATKIENAFVQLQALTHKLESARAEVKARVSYYKLTQGRFENQLASADELSRSIADLAAARAKVAALQASIFNQKAKIYLLEGLRSFEKVVLSR